MKKIDTMYICYLEDGRNYIYANPHNSRAEADETSVVLTEGVKIVTMTSGQRMIEYRRGIYPDNALYTKENKVYMNTYKSGDLNGEPTGTPIMIAEIVES